MLADFIRSIVNWLALKLSDWANPGQAEARAKVEEEAKTEDAAIEQHTAAEKVLTAEAAEEDKAIQEGQAKLDEILKPLPKVDRTEDEEFELLSKRIK